MLLFFILQDVFLSLDGFSIPLFSEYYFLVSAAFQAKKRVQADGLALFCKEEHAVSLKFIYGCLKPAD